MRSEPGSQTFLLYATASTLKALHHIFLGSGKKCFLGVFPLFFSKSIHPETPLLHAEGPYVIVDNILTLSRRS